MSYLRRTHVLLKDFGVRAQRMAEELKDASTTLARRLAPEWRLEKST